MLTGRTTVESLWNALRNLTFKSEPVRFSQMPGRIVSSSPSMGNQWHFSWLKQAPFVLDAIERVFPRSGRITSAMTAHHSSWGRNLLLLLPFLAATVWLSLANPYGTAAADEVSLWIEPGMAVADSPLSGRREISLDVQEIILGKGARGINGIVVTSRRLLGFSSRTLSWTEFERELYEKLLDKRILPAFSVVRTDRRLYGFRGADGTWLEEPLNVRQTVQRTLANDYGAVFITNERLIGFTSLLGDFSSKTLGVHERVTRTDNVNGLISITTNARTFIFGSRLSRWDEFE